MADDKPKTATEILIQQQAMSKMLRHAQRYGSGTGRFGAARPNIQAFSNPSSPDYRNTFQAYHARQKVRAMVLDEYHRLADPLLNADDPVDRLTYAIFNGWWARYRNTAQVYNDDEVVQAGKIAEVRVAFAKCRLQAEARARMREAARVRRHAARCHRICITASNASTRRCARP